MYFPCLRPGIRHFLKEPVQWVSQALGAKTLTATGFSLCLGHLRGQNAYFEKIITTYFKFKCYIIEFFNLDFLFVVFKFCTLYIWLSDNIKLFTYSICMQYTEIVRKL